MTDIDPMSFVRRAEAVGVRMSEVHDRCNRAVDRGDLEAAEAARVEAELLVANLREIRLEQLEAENNGYRDPNAPRRRWWQFWR
jgi:hypothetical protein